jgi:hypothetical protein
LYEYNDIQYMIAQQATGRSFAAMAAEPALFCAKVRRLAVVGGLRRVGGSWEPDDSHNNLFDLPAATAAYAFCLARAVPDGIVCFFVSAAALEQARRLTG